MEDDNDEKYEEVSEEYYEAEEESEIDWYRDT